jgi:hypothetical protein
MDAFISHASKDAALAARMEKLLENKGLAVWLDHSEIRLGVLLRKELLTAIKKSRVLILLWSTSASKSRWVAAEVLSAYHLNRFIITCASDRTRLPYFLQDTIYLNLRGKKSDWVNQLSHAVRNSPDRANEVLTIDGRQNPRLQQAIDNIDLGQSELFACLDKGDLAGAKKKHRRLDSVTAAARRSWPLDPVLLNLAGYHFKNAYMLKHWEAIQAGRPPQDRLLERAERLFFESLFVNPNDYSAVNGLGSVLFFERDLGVAEFFVRRALRLAKQDGVDYAAAKEDLAMILALKKRK